MADFVLSLMVLAALVLAGGAWWLWRNKRAGKQALLMLAMAAILAVNVGIWTLPNEEGKTLASGAPAQ
jgi:drug/metabolite transporter superfamily protein YnfA